MKRLSLIASALAVLGLTACEKTLVEDIADVGNGQVKNSVLQVRTRAGGLASDEATISYPVTVYVFQGEECQAVQTIGDEGADAEHSTCGRDVLGVCRGRCVGFRLCAT